MITNVPDHNDLASIAAGWLNLSWNIAIKEAEDLQEAGSLIDGAIAAHGQERVERAMEEYWDGRRLELNNSLSLLQQSMELFLKSKIAEVSPFLLIAGEIRSWALPNEKTGCIDFADLRTIDATQLCRAAQAIAKQPPPDKFAGFYERLRKTRNKIVHLNGGNVKSEVKAILVDILTAHKFLFPNQLWVEFLRRGELTKKDDEDCYYILFGASDDFSNDEVCREVEAALCELEPSEALAFFAYRLGKPSYRCPMCLSRRSGYTDREHEFVQMQNDKTLRCVSCLSSFSIKEYKEKIVDYFHYLDEGERKQIAAELDKDFPHNAP